MNIPVFYWCRKFGFGRPDTSTWMERVVLLEEQIARALDIIGEGEIPTGDHMGFTPSAVFVAPEYLFRPLRNPGMETVAAESFPEEQKNAIVQALLGISERYPSVLIFGGTVVWHKPIDKVSKVKLDEALAQWTRLGKVEIEKNDDSFDPSNLIRQEAQRRREKLSGRITAWQGLRCDFDKQPRLFREEGRTLMAGHTQVQSVEQKKEALMSPDLRNIVKNTCFVCYGGKQVLKYSKQNDFHEVYQDASTQFIPGAKAPTIRVWGKTLAMMICADYNDRGIKSYVDTEANIWVTISDVLLVGDLPPTGTKEGFAAHIAAAGDARFCKLRVRSNISAKDVKLDRIANDLIYGLLSIPH
jgi:hypothetical protein